MSLTRTALRLQAIETLNSEPLIAAVVEGRCFDSRISALNHREPVPVILVTTEETKGEGWSQQNGGAPFNLSCDLVLEIAMNVLGDDGNGNPVVGVVSTDRALEAFLDLIEEAAIEVLTVGETPAARLLRRVVTRRAPRFASSRFATDQTGERLAIRLLTLSVDLQTHEPGTPLDAPTGAYANLPEPLRSVALALPEGSARKTCDALAARLSPATATRFAGVDALLAPQALDPATPPDWDRDRDGGAAVSVIANP